MNPLNDLAEKLERVAELLARSPNRNHVAWGRHLAEDARGVRLIAAVWREPAEVVGS